MERSLLVIDDSPVARQEILRILQKTDLFRNYCEAGGVLEGFKAVLARPMDVVICDLEMPEMDGLKFLSLMNGRRDLRDIPVILLTGREDAESKIRGLEQGASDYVTKPFDPGELVARVKVQLKVKMLQDRLKESNRRLKELSYTDPLTGLCNRRSLMEKLQKELQRSDRTGAPLALVMADLDHFKKINDTYGHQEGDQVLRDMAELLRRNLRPYDTAARFGGEEFALVLPDCTHPEAIQAAERIRAAVSELPFGLDRQETGLTISLGVAVYPQERIRTVDNLIREADWALYRAKGGGRNQVVWQYE
jgi:diguanylate cyclase (GGDEF)-like protein